MNDSEEDAEKTGVGLWITRTKTVYFVVIQIIPYVESAHPSSWQAPMPEVTGIVYGSGAYECGAIRVGDNIVKVNGQRVRDLPTVDVRRLLAGPEDSTVEMQVMFDASENPEILMSKSVISRMLAAANAEGGRWRIGARDGDSNASTIRCRGTLAGVFGSSAARGGARSFLTASAIQVHSRLMTFPFRQRSSIHFQVADFLCR